MSHLLVGLVALGVSGLTLFSGFGLGTLLMPVLAVFMPVDVAVAATAVVHLGNNIIKVSFFGRDAVWAVVLRFGLPAVLCAFAGAAALGLVAHLPPLFTYDLWGHTARITPVKLVIAALMLAFAAVELLPRLRQLELDRRHLVWGGVLSGFFGGLSGHQGALRAAFLAKAGLTPPEFVGTTAVVSLGVDLARVSIYSALFFTQVGRIRAAGGWSLIAVAMLAAFTGVVIGKRLVKKITIGTIQTLTGVMLFLIAVAMGSGVL